MAHVSREQLLEQLDATAVDSLGLFETDAMTVGLKRYSEGTAREKGTRTHADDELHYVLSGAGEMRVGDETHSVDAGDLLYVERGASHDIVEVEDELTVLKVRTD